ncbi:MAG: MFS transporter [Candidatus Heimdallarchaeota archaeon]|nr:MFS transporter [Candidatus Heimdallarchaeota archaeon]
MTSENDTTASFKDVIKSMNYNVKFVFAFYIFSSLGRGIWMGNVLSTYIFLFAENAGGLFGLSSNEILGLTSAASGITMTLFVFPAGFMADRFRRDIILKSATVIGIASMGFLIFGNSIIYILISLLLWGLFNAFVRPSLEALFADSVESGYRSKLYSWGHLVNQIAMALGPFINIGLFFIFGNEWELSILKSVMLVGLAISLLSIILMLFFKDQKSLGEESEAITEEVTQVVDELPPTSRFANLDSNKAAKLIPIILVASNVIIGVGAGMTIKYFPIFFMELYSLSPIWLQVVMGATALATGVLGIGAQKISLKLGRVETIFFVQFIATACLLIIATYPPLWVLIPIFIARGSFMNAGQPLSRSILMDIIPKTNRGKWNSVEAIAWGLFWNVSAFIGGFLIGDTGRYALCFIITTFVYIVGMIPMIFLLPLVGKEREAIENGETKEKNEALNESEGELMSEAFKEEAIVGKDEENIEIPT